MSDQQRRQFCAYGHLTSYPLNHGGGLIGGLGVRGVAAVVGVCRSCGTTLRQNANFCDECGSRTESETAEYKQVTVLFADVVRSMDIAATLDVERYREVIGELVEAAAGVVHRYGGGCVEYTGDGLMALFGAPIALEDHAFRACLAGLGIQEAAKGVAEEVRQRDGVPVQLRVGLNSGQVIAGQSAAGSRRYSAIGAHVGFAQRMESVAPPGGVMLSQSTARLVENLVTLGETEFVRIKHAGEPVPVRRLLAIAPREAPVERTEASLVGRRWEMVALGEILNRAVGGRGGIVRLVGPPGIGKSRMAREAAAAAADRGVEVVWTFCESHASDVPFRVVTQLLRKGTGVAGLDGDVAREVLSQQVPDADPQDLLLLNDLLGIAEPGTPLPQVNPDARRRRLTTLINGASLARTDPALFIIEDAQWIDSVSESMISDLLSVIPHAPTMVLITYRPEYDGALAQVRDAHTIALGPLSHPDSAALITELVGSDASVSELAAIIVERAAGNAFFAEEMVRELAQSGTLTGELGSYICRADVAEFSVPPTVQAAIEARIDRLSSAAKRTLSAASVLGVRFGVDLLTDLGVDAVLDELLDAELVDQVGFSPGAEYAFRHPLIRAVAYESQLRADRAELHQRVAAALEARHDGTADDNAALLAEHLEAAGELPSAYHWHMRAASWATERDIAAARRSWTRACAIADALPPHHADRTSMRIAPRTMLCGIAWRVHGNVAGAPFDELRELCTAAGDKTSLTIAMAGLVMDQSFRGHLRYASPLASETWEMIESIGDPALTVGLSFPVVYAKAHSGEWYDVLHWSQRAIDQADGDPSQGNLLFGTPIAIALVTRGIGRYCLGIARWSEDLDEGKSIAAAADPFSYATVLAYIYFPGIPFGALAANDEAIREIEHALRIAERLGDDMALAFARVTLGVALLHRKSAAERASGQKVLVEAREVLTRREHNLSELRLINAYLAREMVRQGNVDEGLALVRTAILDVISEGQLLSWGIPVTGVLVETLLGRGAEMDCAEAEVAIERLAAASNDQELAIRDIWLLRLRALLARSRGDGVAHRELANRYRVMAQSLGFEAHSVWAEAMIDGDG